MTANFIGRWPGTPWIAAGAEIVGIVGACLGALFSPPTVLSVDGSIDVVGSSSFSVAPTQIEITYVDLPFKPDAGQQVRVRYVDAGADGWRALSITVEGLPSATYLTRDGRTYEQKQHYVWLAYGGFLVGLVVAASAGIAIIVAGFQGGAPAVAIATATAPWTLLALIPAFIIQASIQADPTLERLATGLWLGSAITTVVASVVALQRHEPGSRILLATISVTVGTSAAWIATWLIEFFRILSGFAH